MSTKEQHSILQALQDYFDNTSPEQIEKDWQELNQYGPDMEECLELGRLHCIEMMKSEDYQMRSNMTSEDKDLLLRDLCARLPYGVIVHFKSRETNGDVVLSYGNICYVPQLGEGWWSECKPYLRPMSSMTEKERKEYQSLCELNVTYYYFDTIESLDWLNAHHFDYRGLIPRGLAISTDEFNPYKEIEL